MGGTKRTDAFWRKLHEKIEAGYSAGRVKAEMLAQAGVRANVYWYNCQRLGLKRLALKGLPRRNENGNGNG